MWGDKDTFDLFQTRERIDLYVKSQSYQERVKRILLSNLTGVIIPAGGPRLVTNLLVTLKVLREHHKSQLPVEVMWQGAGEMDDKTWGSINERFLPIRGVDIQKTPHPVPGLHHKQVHNRPHAPSDRLHAPSDLFRLRHCVINYPPHHQKHTSEELHWKGLFTVDFGVPTCPDDGC